MPIFSCNSCFIFIAVLYYAEWIYCHVFIHSTVDWHLGCFQCFSSVDQLCPTLCHPMDCSMPGFPVHHQLSELTQTSSQWCHPTISSSVIPFSSCPQSLPTSGSFPKCQLFAWGGQSIGVSVSPSVLPMNIEDWFPLGWTGWISLLSKGLSRVFSNTTVQKHQFFGAQCPTLTSMYDYWQNYSFD